MKWLEPLRFAALPAAVLDIHIEDLFIQKKGKAARNVAFCSWGKFTVSPSVPKPNSDDTDSDGDTGVDEDGDTEEGQTLEARHKALKKVEKEVKKKRILLRRSNSA
ncbi:hypothetical protein BGZ47_003730 [Haplosporangium gracile]|nr:hypothetical protein BGZ47_003730 [Haplosporangium gracile]